MDMFEWFFEEPVKGMRHNEELMATPKIVQRANWFAWYPVITGRRWTWLKKVRWTQYESGYGQSAMVWNEYDRLPVNRWIDDI
ncbi:hypothetical protein EVB27_062 [Rhizobium phage RHph_TM16]|nr:hypothetical protein EVB27_062 [Rhizobium phage RHph_TM16]